MNLSKTIIPIILVSVFAIAGGCIRIVYPEGSLISMSSDGIEYGISASVALGRAYSEYYASTGVWPASLTDLLSHVTACATTEHGTSEEPDAFAPSSLALLRSVDRVELVEIDGQSIELRFSVVRDGHGPEPPRTLRGHMRIDAPKRRADLPDSDDF